MLLFSLAAVPTVAVCLREHVLQAIICVCIEGLTHVCRGAFLHNIYCGQLFLKAVGLEVTEQAPFMYVCTPLQSIVLVAKGKFVAQENKHITL